MKIMFAGVLEAASTEGNEFSALVVVGQGGGGAGDLVVEVAV